MLTSGLDTLRMDIWQPQTIQVDKIMCWSISNLNKIKEDLKKKKLKIAPMLCSIGPFNAGPQPVVMNLVIQVGTYIQTLNIRMARNNVGYVIP